MLLCACVCEVWYEPKCLQTVRASQKTCVRYLSAPCLVSSYSGPVQAASCSSVNSGGVPRPINQSRPCVNSSGWARRLRVRRDDLKPTVGEGKHQTVAPSFIRGIPPPLRPREQIQWRNVRNGQDSAAGKQVRPLKWALWVLHHRGALKQSTLSQKTCSNSGNKVGTGTWSWDTWTHWWYIWRWADELPDCLEIKGFLGKLTTLCY